VEDGFLGDVGGDASFAGEAAVFVLEGAGRRRASDHQEVVVVYVAETLVDLGELDLRGGVAAILGEAEPAALLVVEDGRLAGLRRRVDREVLVLEAAMCADAGEGVVVEEDLLALLVVGDAVDAGLDRIAGR
jgi:hypothetical protein